MEKENKVLEEVVNRKFSKIKGRCDLRKLSSVLLEQRLLHGYLGWGVSWPHTRVPTCSTRDGGCRQWSVGLPDQAGESPEGNPPKGNFMLNSEKMRKKKVCLLRLYLENGNRNYENKFAFCSVEHAFSYHQNYAKILMKKAGMKC